jgi:methylated-DNA-[protein]-cysteine S-methyltransferase
MTTSTNGTVPATDLSVVTALRELAEPKPEALAALHRRLEDAAAEADLIDLAYRTVDSPVGLLLLAATARGLARVAFETEDHDRVLDALASRVGSRVLRSPSRLDAAARELDEYFAGRRTGFDLPLDFVLSRGFRQTVQQYLPSIAYGQTRSYAEVARSVGRPTAVRAVGTACATNPLPVVVPCHRVLRSDGGLGGYLGGTQAKRTLLAMEATR